MKEIFVFGAGASAASAGIPFPLGKNLVWTYFQDCHDFSELDNNGQVTSEDRRKKFGQFGDLLEFLKSKPEFKEYADQLEQMINDPLTQDFNVSKEYYIDELMDILLKENNQRIMRLVKCLAVKHIAELSSDAPNNLYKAFVQRLVGTVVSEVSIISFNFDCLLHEDSKNGVYFDYLLDFYSITNTRGLSYQKGRGIPLIKLHGSLDWAVNPETNQINLHYLPLRADMYYLADGSQCSSEEPYIFLPHQTKNGMIERLWERAKAELRQADKITVIGYSFPGYDNDVINLFRQNVRSEVDWQVVDYEENQGLKEIRKNEIKNKYAELFPAIKKFVIYVDGFEEHLRRMERV